jgi:hypothetical protein
MAAKVGSVIVDVVANTAEFEAGMRRAASVTQGVGDYVTEKSYASARAQARAGMAAQSYADASRGLEMSIGGAVASMSRQLGVGGPLASSLLRLGAYTKMLAARARDATAAHGAQAAAGKGAASVAGMMAGTLALTAAKVAILTAAVYAGATAWKRYQEAKKIVERGTEGTTEYLESNTKWLKQYHGLLMRTIPDEERIIGLFRERSISLEEARVRLTELAEAQKDTTKEVDKWLWDRGLDDFGKKLQSIRDQYAEIGAKATDIADAQVRAAAMARLDEMKRAELLETMRKAEEETAKKAREAHVEKMNQYREQSRALVEMMTRAAGLASGQGPAGGAEAWRAIHAAARQESADKMQARMLERSGAGALDSEDKDNLRKIRDYLMTLANSEAVAI